MNKPKYLSFWLILLGLTLFLGDVKLVFGRIIFYPPELTISFWFIFILFRDKGLGGFRQLIHELPRFWKFSIGLVLIGAIIGTVVSPIFPQSLGALKSWFIFPMIAALIAQREKLTWQDLIPLFVTLSVGLVVLGLGLFEWGAGINRLRGIYQSPNYFAQLGAPVLCFLYIAFRKNKLNHALYLPIILLLFVSLILSQSIGGLLGLIIVIVGYELIGKPVKLSWLFMPIFLVSLVLIILLSYQRLSVGNNSLDSRVQIWGTALEIIQRQPLSGSGLRGFEINYPTLSQELYPSPIDKSVAQPHNLILSFWVNMGVIGFIGMLLLLFRALKRLDLASPVWWAVIGIFIIGILDTPYWRVDLAIMFWLYLAVLENDGLKNQSTN